MAKSARASSIKKNKSGLKKRVFGPVERARNDRLNSKLLAIINQEKPLRAEMEVETAEAASADTEAKDDDSMAVDGATLTKTTSSTSTRAHLDRHTKQKLQKAKRIEKSHRHRKQSNSIVFAKTGKARSVSRAAKR